jgi:hypothetical protein
MASTDAEAMVQSLEGRISRRKVRLFLCALARRSLGVVTSGRSRRAVAAAEQFADGAVPKQVMTAHLM